MKTFFFALSILIIGCSDKQTDSIAVTAPSLPILTIQSGNTNTYQEYPVLIEGKVNIEIRPQVDGYLNKLFVDEGAYVKAGQPLFKIDEQPYLEQYNNTQANLNAAEASLINAQLEIDKLEPLIQNKIVSDYKLKTAKANYKMTVANVQQAKAMVAAAKINLDFTLIKAPVNGYISRLPKKQGSLVSRTDIEALTKLSDIHEVYVYFSLGETDFINFKSQYEGNSIDEKLKNLPPVSLLLSDNTTYPEQGKIDMVDGQFDRNTGAITLRAVFPNPKGLLRSGNTGKVQLSLAHSDAILIPQSSTIEVQDKIFVFTIDKENKVSKQPITTIGRNGTDYLVRDGLQSGDRIVSKGFESLQDGVVITPEKNDKVIAKK